MAAYVICGPISKTCQLKLYIGENPHYLSANIHSKWRRPIPYIKYYPFMEHISSHVLLFQLIVLISLRPFFLYFPLTSPHCVHPDFKDKGNCGTYGAFMEETDYRIGQVLQALEDNNLSSNTIVILTSDNGAETNYIDHINAFQHYSNVNYCGGNVTFMRADIGCHF